MSSNTLRMGIGDRQKPRKAKGGAQAYRKGATAERRAKKALEADGWFVIRTPQSRSAVDLVCIRPDIDRAWLSCVHWIQMKSSGYLRPAEKEAVIALARQNGGWPVLGWIEKNTLKRRYLTTGDLLEDLPCPR